MYKLSHELQKDNKTVYVYKSESWPTEQDIRALRTEHNTEALHFRRESIFGANSHEHIIEVFK